MPFHLPSFLAGSFISGTAFLVVHQQISYRNRLTYRWPVAEFVESSVREQWKEIKAKINENSTAQVTSREFSSLSKYWNDSVDQAKAYFDKKD